MNISILKRLGAGNFALLVLLFLGAAKICAAETVVFHVPFSMSKVSVPGGNSSVQITCAVFNSASSWPVAINKYLGPMIDDGTSNDNGLPIVISVTLPAGVPLSVGANWSCNLRFIAKDGKIYTAEQVAKPGTVSVGEAKGVF